MQPPDYRYASYQEEGIAIYEAARLPRTPGQRAEGERHQREWDARVAVWADWVRPLIEGIPAGHILRIALPREQREVGDILEGVDRVARGLNRDEVTIDISRDWETDEILVTRREGELSAF